MPPVVILSFVLVMPTNVSQQNGAIFQSVQDLLYLQHLKKLFFVKKVVICKIQVAHSLRFSHERESLANQLAYDIHQGQRK